MKAVLLLFLLIGVEARAQSLADVARAERERQAAIHAVKEFEEVGEKVAVAEAEDVGKQPAEAETEAEIPLDERLHNERVTLIKERGDLLVRLDQLRDDPEAAKSVQEQLIALTKRAESLKLQHLESTKENSESVESVE